MPRYFFHTADGSRDRDTTGTELPDLGTARAQAIKFIGQLVGDHPAILSENQDFRVEVTDQEDLMLFTVIILAVDAPAAATALPINRDAR